MMYLFSKLTEIWYNGVGSSRINIVDQNCYKRSCMGTSS